MPIAQLTGAHAGLNQRIQWALRRTPPLPPPRARLVLSMVCAAALNHAADAAVFAAGMAVLAAALPLAAAVVLAAAAAAVARRWRLRPPRLPWTAPGPGWKTIAPPPAPALQPTQRRQMSATDHVYFSVRALADQGGRRVLQYAFVDDRGNVVFSALGQGEGTPSALALEPPEDLAADPIDPEALEYLLTRICGGATLVTFGRVLQAGLLPPTVRQQAASVECAWRRYLRVSRKHGLRFDRGQPMTLNEALAIAGLPAVESADAALRALAIRELWAWMDLME